MLPAAKLSMPPAIELNRPAQIVMETPFGASKDITLTYLFRQIRESTTQSLGEFLAISSTALSESQIAVRAEIHQLKKMAAAPVSSALVAKVERIATRIAMQIPSDLTAAGFLGEDGELELILVNAKNDRRVYLDLDESRAEIWAHMIAPPSEGSTITVTPDSSIAPLITWLNG